MTNEKKKIRKLVLIPIIVLLLVPVLVSIIIAVGSNMGTGDYKLVLIKTETKTTEEEASNINDIIKQVGIDNFTKITYDELLNDIEGQGTKGYRITTSYSDNIILYVDSSNKVFSIRWADRDFYKDGKPLLNVNDFLMTSDEKTKYQLDAQKRIKLLLKSPSSAKFPNITEWKFAKDNGDVMLQAYVDSENSYGAKIRGEFQIAYLKNGTVKSLIFDGTEYIK